MMAGTAGAEYREKFNTDSSPQYTDGILDKQLELSVYEESQSGQQGKIASNSPVSCK